MLRPKWCISVASNGLHNVCVCAIHQNVKLMVNSLPIKIDYRELIDEIVCDRKSYTCMLRDCEQCPPKENLRNKLFSFFNNEEQDITYKEWQTTDRTEIITIKTDLETYIEKLITKIYKLKSHHFLTKMQSGYLKKLKENIGDEEVIILLDFAENYTFKIQDKIQENH